MNPLIKELRKRSLDRERLQVILDEVRGDEGLRDVLELGKAACMKHEGRNHIARSAMHSLATIGLALSDLSLSMQKAFPALDWEDLKELCNYIAHDYIKREMPVVWDAVVAYTPILDDAVTRMVAWDSNHPAPAPKDAEALGSMNIQDYVKKAIETRQQEKSGAMDSREPGYNPRKRKGHGDPRP